eukprot:1890553-Pleurochrysis_carterae.AAC.1
MLLGSKEGGGSRVGVPCRVACSCAVAASSRGASALSVALAPTAVPAAPCSALPAPFFCFLGPPVGAGAGAPSVGPRAPAS